MTVTPASSAKAKKNERIEVRVSKEQKKLLQRAAELETGGDMSEFILGCAEPHATDVLRAHDQSDVTDEIRERFYDLLLSPPPPREELILFFAREPSEHFRVVH